MNARRFRRALSVTVLTIVGFSATAQIRLGLEGNEPEFVGQARPASDWIVWRAFHGSMHFYSQKSPEALRRVLAEKLGISGETTDRFLDLSSQYIATYDRVEAEVRLDKSRNGGAATLLPAEVAGALNAAARASVLTQLGEARAPSIPSRLNSGPPRELLRAVEAGTVPAIRVPVQASATNFAITASVPTIPPNTSNWKLIDPASLLTRPVAEIDKRDPMRQEAFASRSSGARASALQDHQRQMLDLVGSTAFLKLTRWIDSEVRDGVRVSDGQVRVSLQPPTSNN